MVSVTSLWLPILLSAVFVFVVSSVIHMFLTYHKNDFKKLPDEDKVMGALREFKLPQGEYFFPYAQTMKEMEAPEYVEKLNNGPVAMMTVMENGQRSMVKDLVMWFFYSLIVSIFAAYIASRAPAPGAHYLEVFRFAGATAFSGYALALMQNSIWYKRSWATTLRSMFDGFIYALVTAGTFGWLWV